ncbi:hypothetical protein TGMAS_273670 [Toxoplasma gondii MAS]|uniref:Uncharacterized protein n=1 Tax=Toxoplasma gondii MAS TaxID=943118 RepID=A0A086QWW2_TOXGO|nr:hypothetical protein TGMAS_273670 [Toxoplasma gondii MAS]
MTPINPEGTSSNGSVSLGYKEPDVHIEKCIRMHGWSGPFSQRRVKPSAVAQVRNIQTESARQANNLGISGFRIKSEAHQVASRAPPRGGKCCCEMELHLSQPSLFNRDRSTLLKYPGDAGYGWAFPTYGDPFPYRHECSFLSGHFASRMRGVTEQFERPSRGSSLEENRIFRRRKECFALNTQQPRTPLASETNPRRPFGTDDKGQRMQGREIMHGVKRKLSDDDTSQVDGTSGQRRVPSLRRRAYSLPIYETDDEQGDSSCSMCRPGCACRPSLLAAHYLAKLLDKTIFRPSEAMPSFYTTEEFFEAMISESVSRESNEGLNSVAKRCAAKTRNTGEETPSEPHSGAHISRCVNEHLRSFVDRPESDQRANGSRFSQSHEGKGSFAVDPKALSSALARYRKVPLFMVCAEEHLQSDWLSQFTPIQRLQDILEPEVMFTRPENSAQQFTDGYRSWEGRELHVPSDSRGLSLSRDDAETSGPSRQNANSSRTCPALRGYLSSCYHKQQRGFDECSCTKNGCAVRRNRVMLVDKEMLEQSGLDRRYVCRLKSAVRQLRRSEKLAELLASSDTVESPKTSERPGNEFDDELADTSSDGVSRDSQLQLAADSHSARHSMNGFANGASAGGVCTATKDKESRVRRKLASKGEATKADVDGTHARQDGFEGDRWQRNGADEPRSSRDLDSLAYLLLARVAAPYTDV